MESKEGLKQNIPKIQNIMIVTQMKDVLFPLVFKVKIDLQGEIHFQDDINFQCVHKRLR